MSELEVNIEAAYRAADARGVFIKSCDCLTPNGIANLTPVDNIETHTLVDFDADGEPCCPECRMKFPVEMEARPYNRVVAPNA